MIVLNDGKGARLVSNEMPGLVLLTHNVQVNARWFSEALMGKEVEELESLGLSVDSAFLSCALYLSPSSVLQPSFWKFVWFATAEWPSELYEEGEEAEMSATYPLQAFLDLPAYTRLSKKKGKPVAAMLPLEGGVLVNVVTDQGFKGVEFYEDETLEGAETAVRAQGIDAYFVEAKLKRPLVANPYSSFEEVFAEEESGRNLFLVSAGVLAVAMFFWVQAGFYYFQSELVAGRRAVLARQVAALEARKKEEALGLKKQKYVQALMRHESLMKALKKLPSCPFREVRDRVEFPLWCREDLEERGFHPRADLKKGVLYVPRAEIFSG